MTFESRQFGFGEERGDEFGTDLLSAEAFERMVGGAVEFPNVKGAEVRRFAAVRVDGFVPINAGPGVRILITDLFWLQGAHTYIHADARGGNPGRGTSDSWLCGAEYIAHGWAITGTIRTQEPRSVHRRLDSASQ